MVHCTAMPDQSGLDKRLGNNDGLLIFKGNAMIDKITVNSNVHFGKPCIAGTRITVQSVLELLNEGLSFEEIIRDYYPDLSVADIQASIQYAIALVTVEEIHLTAAPA